VIFEKEEILTNSGSPYKVYSYYRDKWFERDKPRPEAPKDFEVPELNSDNMPSVEQLGFEKPDEIDWIWEPGRESGKKLLKNLKKNLELR